MVGSGVGKAFIRKPAMWKDENGYFGHTVGQPLLIVTLAEELSDSED
jgi:hypothetical protein